ncbi:hypothetical protein V8C34DRAFT_303442 [Trichoderma compactum]
MAMARDPNGAMNPFAMPFIPLASPQPTFALRCTRKTRSTVRAARHEGGDALSSRGQPSCTTTSSSDRFVGDTATLSQPNAEASEKASYGPESGQEKKDGSPAAGARIIKGSGPNIGNERASGLPETNVVQTYHLSGEKIASGTNDGAVLPGNVRSHNHANWESVAYRVAGSPAYFHGGCASTGTEATG